MPWLSLVQWKLVGIVAAILAFWGYGYYGGVQHEKAKQQIIAAQQLAQAMATERARSQVTLTAERASLEAGEKIRTVTRTLTKVIHDEKLNSDCNLSNGWLLRHNEAAAGSLPGAAGLDHANPSGVTADRALEQVAENYGTCREVRQIAQDCQGWIRGQQAIDAQ